MKKRVRPLQGRGFFGNCSRGLMGVVLVAAALLAGCSKSGGSSSGGTSAQGADKALDASKQVEIILYTMGTERPKDVELYDNFNKIIKEKLNLTLKVLRFGSDYRNRYPLLFSSGEEFDLSYAATWLNFSSMSQRGAFMELDEIFPKYAPKNYARQSKTALKQATVNGHLYAVPTLLATYSAYGPIYRAEMALPYGWDGKMENFEDMERYLDIVKANNPGIDPYFTYNSGSEMDDMFLYFHSIYPAKGSTGDFLFIDPKDPNPKLFAWWEWDKAPEFLGMMARWNAKGFYPKSALANTDGEVWNNGKAALRIHNIDSWESSFRDKSPLGWDVRYTNMTTDISNLAFTQDALAIPTSSKNYARALDLYDLITSDRDVWRAFYYGIQGKSYDIQIEGGQEYMKVLDVDNYGHSSMWAARTKEFTLPTLGAPPDLLERKRAFDAQIKDGVGAQKYRSFTPNTQPVETEYATCLNVCQQYWWPLELGYVDPVKGLQEFKEKMIAAGVEKVRAELQRQLDEYVKNL